MLTDLVGWISATILLLTIGKQIYKQWQEGKSEGVSKWLFLGQVAASFGFTVYSLLLENWVFVVTNILLLISALIGYAILLNNRRRERRKAQPAQDDAMAVNRT